MENSIHLIFELKARRSGCVVYLRLERDLSCVLTFCLPTELMLVDDAGQ